MSSNEKKKQVIISKERFILQISISYGTFHLNFSTVWPYKKTSVLDH